MKLSQWEKSAIIALGFGIEFSWIHNQKTAKESDVFFTN